MLPLLIYRALLHGSESAQQASLPLHSTGHLHEADSISEVHLAPHANGDLSPNDAGARSGEARSQPAVVINFGSGGLYAHQGWDVPSLRDHTCGQILQDYATVCSPGLQKQHDAAADHDRSRKDLRQAHSAASV